MNSKGVAAIPPVALPSLSTAAAEESESRNNNMISPQHTSCASSRKRPFDALDGSGKNDTAAAAACSSTILDTNEPSSSIEALLKDMQHKMNCMQTKFEERMDEMQSEIDTTRDENSELETKCYELESKMEDISSLKDEHNEGTYDNNERMYDMQTEIDTLRDENIELKTKYNELEIKVKDLTLKNEYNEWSYMAEDIPTSYWVERGFAEEEYAGRMVVFLGKMKEYAHQLRRGEPPKTIELLFVNDHMLHDDILLPHWKEFADALKQYQKFEYKGNNINLFAIDNVQLQQEVLDMLSPALQTLDVKSLVLGGNIGSDLVTFLSDIISHNPHIQGIDWRNQIETMDNMRHLSNSIKNKDGASLKYIGFKSAFDGNCPEMMQTVLDTSHQLKYLCLNNNGIGMVGAQLITNWLLSNPPLEEFHLNDNDLGNNDMLLLSNVLQNNTNLKRIDLGNNYITTVGRRVLLESVFDVSSLNSCAASNHSCSLRGINPNISGINDYDNPSLNRIMKIFTVLSATDYGFFNMTCLGDDISYKLIPNVLRLSQDFGGRTPELSEAYFEQTGQTSADWDKLDEDTVPITSMFELLRGWAVPSLSD